MAESTPKTLAADFTILTGEDIVNPKKTPSKKKLDLIPWTEAEDSMLTTLAHRGLRWKIIAEFITSHNATKPIDGVIIERTSKQCVQRYTRVLHPKIRKGTWTAHEDAILKRGIIDLGTSSWAAVSRRIGTRTDIQCRTRWLLWRSQGKCPWMLSQAGAMQEDNPIEKPQRILDDADTETEIGFVIPRKNPGWSESNEFVEYQCVSDSGDDIDAYSVCNGASNSDDFDGGSETLSMASKKTGGRDNTSQNMLGHSNTNITEGGFRALMKATQIVMPLPLPRQTETHRESDSASLPAPRTAPSTEGNGSTQAGLKVSAQHMGGSFKASLSFIMN